MIGNRIKEYREKMGLSQSQLAKSLHVTRQAVSSWERGITEPDIDMIKDISYMLDVDELTLMYGENTSLYNKTVMRVLFAINIILLAIHVYLNIRNSFSIAPFIIAPAMAFIIQMIMYFVFSNSFKSGDFSIIAGYNPETDTPNTVKKQLSNILLLGFALSILTSVFYFNIYQSPTDAVMLISMILCFAILQVYV